MNQLCSCTSNLLRSEQLYTPYYCEENVYHLCHRLLSVLPVDVNIDVLVVFIINPAQHVTLFHQRTTNNKKPQEREKPVVWDYHVIALTLDKSNNDTTTNNNSKSNNQIQSKSNRSISSLTFDEFFSRYCNLDHLTSLIWDLDVDADYVQFPSSFQDYWKIVVKADFNSLFPPSFRPYFRVIPATTFHREFASDRSHMMNNLQYQQPPPKYPPIHTDTCSMNLDAYRFMEDFSISKSSTAATSTATCDYPITSYLMDFPQFQLAFADR